MLNCNIATYEERNLSKYTKLHITIIYILEQISSSIITEIKRKIKYLKWNSVNPIFWF